MKKYSIRFCLTFGLLLCVSTIASSQTAPSSGPRRVEVRWDMTKPDGAQSLQIWVNCKRDSSTEVNTCPAPGEQKRGVDAFSFELKDSDRVILVLTSLLTASQRLEAQYAITGVNVDEKAREAFKKIFSPPAAKDATKAGSGGTAGEDVPKSVVVAVTDDVLAGGKFTATFKKYQRAADGKETLVDNPDPVVLRVRRRNPWFVLSSGLAIVKGPTPSVEIIKTNNIITFTKNGQPQQASETAIHLKDNDDDYRPVETAVAFLNFRLAPEAIYGTVGFPANETVFTQPLLGVSARIPLGHSLGLMVTVGTRFTKETGILETSGFKDGQKLDPTAGLTVGDIPVGPKRHRRFFYSMSLDF